jgi:hypothetical protein
VSYNIDKPRGHMAEIIEQSPIVSHLSWGEMSIEGVGNGCDFKLFPGGGRDWNWSETNTHHRPGIQIADVSELLENKCEVIVLSRGIQSRLQTCPDVFDFLYKKEGRKRTPIIRLTCLVGVY